jgi:hypothetical protein
VHVGAVFPLVAPLPAGSLLFGLLLEVYPWVSGLSRSSTSTGSYMLPQLGVNGVITLRVYFSESTFVGRFECGSSTFLLSCSMERRSSAAKANANSTE